MNPTKLMYIGSGLHLKSLIHFPNTKEFVFVDTQPRSEFDSKSFDKGFFRRNFIPDLILKADSFGFVLESTNELDSEYFTEILSFKQRFQWIGIVKETWEYICPTLMVFYNFKTGQKLKYYVSTNILFNMNFDLEEDLKSSEGLIISGYHPDKKLLKYIKNQITLYCYSETGYLIEPDEIDNFDNIVYWMFNNPDEFDNYFNKIFVCDNLLGNLIESKDIWDMDQIVKNLYLSNNLDNDNKCEIMN